MEQAIISSGIHTPKASSTDVSETRAEYIAQEPKQGEDQVAGTCRISHHFKRAQGGLLLEQAFKDEHGISQRPRHSDAVEASELVAAEIEVRHTFARPQIFFVG